MASGRALFVVAPEGFTEHELSQPKAVLEMEGIDVETCSISRGPCRSSGGAVVHATISIAEARAEDYDVIFVVGGSGCLKYLEHNSELLSLLRNGKANGKIIAAIGRGRHCLASAGLFDGNFASGPPFEVDGNVIAGRPPATTPGWSSRAFGEVVAAHLRKMRMTKG